MNTRGKGPKVCKLTGAWKWSYFLYEQEVVFNDINLANVYRALTMTFRLDESPHHPFVNIIPLTYSPVGLRQFHSTGDPPEPNTKMTRNKCNNA